ncbi:MAG: hypothetical protein PUD77_06905 [Clostridiales bacterium]|nr:hypothetical protein [Clostridiales bacterium]
MTVNDIFGRDIEYLYYSAKELGGTIRQIACDSGLFQAVDYVKLKIDPSIGEPVLSKEDIEPVEDDGSYTLWTEDGYFLGNGANVGWLCHNYYGNELIKPDLYAVEQAMNTYYAECAIRRTEDPDFHIEEISFDDQEVFDHISELLVQTLPANWLPAFLHGEMPTSYKVLAYQIAYIKYRYDAVYREVWSNCPPYLKTDNPDRAQDKDTLGIAVSEEYCSAAYADAAAVTGNVYHMGFDGKGISEKIKFAGIGNLMNTGLACTKLGLALKDICETHKYQRNNAPKKINISLLGMSPTPFFVNRHHENLTDRKEMMAYEALDLAGKDFKEVIRMSAEMAGLEEVQFIDNPVVPIMKYFERNPKTKPAKNDTALVLYMDETQVMVGVAEEAGGKYYGRYFCDKAAMASFDQNLAEKMFEVVRPKIEALQVVVSQEDKTEFAQQVNAVKKQLSRNHKATVVFDNGWLSISEPFSIEQAEECFYDLLMGCEMLMQDLITDKDDDEVLDYWLPDIKKLYLAGSMTDYKILRDLIKREGIFGGKKELFLCGEPENVLTAGLALL